MRAHRGHCDLSFYPSRGLEHYSNDYCLLYWSWSLIVTFIPPKYMNWLKNQIPNLHDFCESSVSNISLTSKLYIVVKHHDIENTLKYLFSCICTNILISHTCICSNIFISHTWQIQLWSNHFKSKWEKTLASKIP